MAETGADGMRERSAEKHQSDGTHPTSQRYQRDCEHARGGGGLHLSTEETSPGPVCQARQPRPTTPVSGYNGLDLDRTHVEYTFSCSPTAKRRASSRCSPVVPTGSLVSWTVAITVFSSDSMRMRSASVAFATRSVAC